MNNIETIAFFKGKKEGLKTLRKELKFFRDRIEEEIRICKNELEEWKL